MSDEDRLERLLRSALPPVAASGRTRDLWPLVVRRSQARLAWSLFPMAIVPNAWGAWIMLRLALLLLRRARGAMVLRWQTTADVCPR